MQGVLGEAAALHIRLLQFREAHAKLAECSLVTKGGLELLQRGGYSTDHPGHDRSPAFARLPHRQVVAGPAVLLQCRPRRRSFEAPVTRLARDCAMALGSRAEDVLGTSGSGAGKEILALGSVKTWARNGSANLLEGGDIRRLIGESGVGFAIRGFWMTAVSSLRVLWAGLSGRRAWVRLRCQRS